MKLFLKIVGLLILLLMGKCSYLVYQMVDKFPDEASQEYLISRYKNFMHDIDQSIETSNSLSDLIRSLESIPRPEDLMLFSIDLSLDEVSAGDIDMTALEIVDKHVNPSVKSVWNDFGYGYSDVDDIDVLIWHYPVNLYGVNRLIIYFDYEAALQRESEVRKPVIKMSNDKKIHCTKFGYPVGYENSTGHNIGCPVEVE